MGIPNFPVNAMAAAAGATRAPLPPLRQHADGLTRAQTRAMVVAIVALHVAAVYGLLQVKEVRDVARDLAPILVNLIAPETPPVPPAPPPPVQQPIQKKQPPAPVIAAAPSPAPAAFVVPVQPVEAPQPAVLAEPVVQAPPAPVAAAPKIIPASAVQYLEPPAPEYPRLSRRNAESGKVLLRVFIDTAGLPRNVQVSTSSGHVRLDDSAVSAVQKARFKPYTENGLPTAGWTIVPIYFELEK